jgi:hypothetical protein
LAPHNPEWRQPGPHAIRLNNRPGPIGDEAAIDDYRLAGNETCCTAAFAARDMRGPERPSTMRGNRPAVTGNSIKNCNLVEMGPTVPSLYRSGDRFFLFRPGHISSQTTSISSEHSQEFPLAFAPSDHFRNGRHVSAGDQTSMCRCGVRLEFGRGVAQECVKGGEYDRQASRKDTWPVETGMQLSLPRSECEEGSCDGD